MIPLIIVLVVVLLGLVMAVKIVKQYEQGVLFRLGKVLGVRQPGLRMIIPFVDVLHRVSLRIITMPIQSQGIISPRQRQRRCIRGRLLPRRRRGEVGRRDRKRARRH